MALAPMADYTDSPFCRICREVAGKDFVIFREMVSSEALVRDNERTLQMCEFNEIERPIIIQIFGSDPQTISKAVKIVNEKFKPNGIDINMGCPVPKITGKNQAGSALMKDPNKAVEIVKKIKQDNPDIVVSVKTRLGWSKEDKILEFAPKLEQAGADLLTIHGRTRAQGYSGQANWQVIGRVKQTIKIPIIANGDIANHDDMKRCLDMTGVDGVMIGRGALGNPWIFSEKQFGLKEKISIILKHAQYHVEHYGEGSMVSFRKHLAWYFKSDHLPEIENVKKIRGELVRVSTLDELRDKLNQFF
ncbi:MAG: tRNA dihydrouridine synthase DusB [bacterium]